MLGVVVLVALAVSVYLAISLEIIKLRHVRERNARIAAERDHSAAPGDVV
jgi:hypothetical protein